MDNLNSRQHAVVIGGSIAGLLAARVLADHFARVTIIERDHLPDDASPRKGAPQARHVHILLQRGQLILEQLFPGIDRELESDGAPLVDWTDDVKWLSAYGWMPRYHGMLIRACSRDLLESRIRRRLAAHPKVRWIEHCDVNALLADAGDARIGGVLIRPRAQATLPDEPGATALAGDEFIVRADLVVDASGRSSRAPAWLEALGYAAPRESVINSFQGYASRIYQRPANFDGDWKVALVRSNPALSTRGGGIYPIEGDRWMVTLAGARRDYPPTDDASFLDFARSLPSSLLYDALRDAQPLSSLSGYQRTENRLRRYEELKRRPENFAVVGDAVCAFNPVYGQGMSVAALGATTLDACLREQQRRKPNGDLTGLAARFQKRLAKVNKTPWLLATGEDARVAASEGVRVSRASRLLRRYMERVLRATTSDLAVTQVFMDVAHLLRPPSALFHPRIALRALGARTRGSEPARSAINYPLSVNS